MLNKNLQQRSQMTVKGSPDDILSLAYGGKPQKLADGGMAEGPSHEEGGIPVAQEQTGEQVAEIEGGERVFSKEDTAAIEQASMHIIQAQESGDRNSADDMAMKLGYAVVNMLAAQEKNQAAQEEQMAGRAGAGQEGGEGQPAEPSEEEAQAMNQFGPLE